MFSDDSLRVHSLELDGVSINFNLLNDIKCAVLIWKPT